MSEEKVSLVGRVRHFFSSGLWTHELRPGTIAAAGIRLLQLTVVIAEGFVRHQLLLRTGALTYITVLSMIPLVAMVLSVLKALGVSGNIAEYVVEEIPAVTDDTQTQLLQMIQGVEIGRLGVLGGVVFVVMTVLTLRHLESTLNDLWGVSQSRGWARRFADYLAVLIIGPLFISAALSLGTTIQAAPFVTWIASIPGVAVLYSMGLEWVPTGLFAIGFTFMYWFFPNTRVRVTSAVLGGCIAAVFFSANQYVYVAFNVGAAKYNVLFGGFAALPLLFIWIYISWAIFLMGAEICFAHQNLNQYRREIQDKPPGDAEREASGIRIVLHVARAFRDRSPPCTPEELADCVDLSVREVNGILERLMAVGILAETVRGGRGHAFQLGRPADDIALADILLGLRGERRAVVIGEDEVNDLVEGIIGELRGIESPFVDGRTLSDLMQNLSPREPALGKG